MSMIQTLKGKDRDFDETTLLRARLVATSNLHFDPGYGGLPQNAILLLSGMSGCHKNSIIKTQ